MSEFFEQKPPETPVYQVLQATGGQDVPKRVRLDAPLSSRGAIREMVGIIRRGMDAVAALDEEMRQKPEDQYIRIIRSELMAVQSRLKDLHHREISVLRERSNQPIDQPASLRVVNR